MGTQTALKWKNEWDKGAFYPPLFNLDTEYIMHRSELQDNTRIKIGGRTINSLRYTDDTTLLAEQENAMKKLL